MNRITIIAAALLALPALSTTLAPDILTRSDLTMEVWGPECPLNGQQACENEAANRCGGDGWPYGVAVRSIAQNNARYNASPEGGVCTIQCPGHTYVLACNHRDDGLVASW